MTTKEQIEYIDSLTSGRILTGHDLEKFAHIKQNIAGRLSAGRPRVHASDRERYRFHNAKRREAKRRMSKKTSDAIDIADTVL